MALMAVVAAATEARGGVIYVDDSAIGGSNDGSSWPNAFIDLQSALAVAQAGDEIRIGQGEYKPATPGGPREATFNLYDGAIVRGGYAGLGAPDPDANDPSQFITTLSGDLNGNDLFDAANFHPSHADNSLHVVSAHAVEPAANLFGLTIRGGYAPDNEGPHDRGGGINSTNSTLLLERMVIERNCATHYGGGVFADGNPNPTVLSMSNCLVQYNGLPGLSSYGDGAGVAAWSNALIVDCLFRSNGGGGGKDAGGLSLNGIARRCRFIGNIAEDGGALAGRGLITDCYFEDNRAGYWGGAMFLTGSTTVMNCVFLRNLASIEGGAITTLGSSSKTVVNSVFSGNHAADHAGAVLNLGSLSLINCTLIGNSVSWPEAAVHQRSTGLLSIENCILWQNTGNDLINEGTQVRIEQGPVLISHSTIEGWTGGLGGTGNDGLDPVLVDANGPDNVFGTLDDNARLSPDSPARDTGDTAALPADAHDLDGDGNITEPIPYDLDARRRVVGPSVDRGCYEFQTCPGDIAPVSQQGDGMVDVVDLLTVITSWGPCSAPCPADIVPDATVNVQDLLSVILGWGVCR